MSEEASVVEAGLAKTIGESFSGKTPSAPEHETEIPKYEFDENFQLKILTLMLRDGMFLSRTSGLIKPQYFENRAQGCIANVILKYYEKYKTKPDIPTFTQLIKDDFDSKIIRNDEQELVKEELRKLNKSRVSDVDYIVDKVAEFARHQEVSQAVLESVGLIDSKQFDKILNKMKDAVNVGANDDHNAYDYFKEIASRSAERIDKEAGILPPKGITTGNAKIDDRLMHRGWGRKELSVIMGGAKSGKTTALVNFAKSASLVGFNVLYVTLEVSARIIGERLDAVLSDTMIAELSKKSHDVKKRIAELEKGSGKLIIHEFATGQLTPRALNRLIEKYKSAGITFDLVVVDYADLMAPNFHYNSTIENSKSIYVDLRGISFEHDCALLTATQTNREGFKAVVAKAEHVAEDFNKVRIADLLISINISDEERAKGEARLFFAVSRNQESGFTIVVRQNLAKMKFIESVLRVE